MSAIDVKQLDEQALFAQALDVMNRAIRKHADSVPYKQLLSLSDRVIGEKPIAVGVTRETGSDPYDFYTVRFHNGRYELVGRGKRDDPDLTWSVTRDYLEGVVQDAERYIEHPERLDLDWLKNRLGID
ncbi:MAG: hypothetical protein PVF43_15565 [Candidatus Eiseniibacteriota bacterium]|jgi:hypothetical protein